MKKTIIVTLLLFTVAISVKSQFTSEFILRCQTKLETEKPWGVQLVSNMKETPPWDIFKTTDSLFMDYFYVSFVGDTMKTFYMDIYSYDKDTCFQEYFYVLISSGQVIYNKQIWSIRRSDNVICHQLTWTPEYMFDQMEVLDYTYEPRRGMKLSPYDIANHAIERLYGQLEEILTNPD